jgi:uncharacterized membrane protein YkvA (DUF1232 family)
MAKPEETLAVLQRFVDGYVDATETAMKALADTQTPAAARRILCGALNYCLDLLDMFPDHYKGMGVADDAMLLRIAARQAVAAGAPQPKLKALADEAVEVEPLLAELAAPLETYVTKLPERTVRGRTTDQILGSKDVFAVFTADVNRQVASYKPEKIPASVNAAWEIKELRNMIKHALQKSGA